MVTACPTSDIDPADLDGTVRYRPRRPHETILYQTILEHLETWMARCREANPDDDPIPGYVEEAFRAVSDVRDPVARVDHHRLSTTFGKRRARSR